MAALSLLIAYLLLLVSYEVIGCVHTEDDRRVEPSLKSLLSYVETLHRHQDNLAAEVTRVNEELVGQKTLTKNLEIRVRQLGSELEEQKTLAHRCLDLPPTHQESYTSNIERGVISTEKLVKPITGSGQKKEVNESLVEGMDHASEMKNRRNIGDASTKVAFSARAYDMNDIGLHQIIPFENVITNVGNLYHPQTGVFYCDLSGVYVFFVQISSVGNEEVFVELVKNGANLIYVMAPHITSQLGNSGNMVTVQLQKGDSVWVRSSAANSGPALHDFSYFSGFLLYPLN